MRLLTRDWAGAERDLSAASEMLRGGGAGVEAAVAAVAAQADVDAALLVDGVGIARGMLGDYDGAAAVYDRAGLLANGLAQGAGDEQTKRMVREKADAHDWGGGGATPASVVAFFVDWLMPLTKAAQVRYFMRRLDGGGGRGLAPPSGGE